MSERIDEITEDFALRQAGVDWNLTLDPPYYEQIKENERLFAGDAWHGVQAAGLPKPNFGVGKRIINHFVSSIMSQRITSTVRGINISKDGDSATEILAREVTRFANDTIPVVWERQKVDSLLRQALFDAAIAGDACAYCWLDMTKNTRNRMETDGEIAVELIDATNVHFGNPNDSRVQAQPYIIISYRDTVGNLKRKAAAAGAKKAVVDRICGDSDTDYQAGERFDNEVSGSDDNAKATAVIKLWKEDVDGEMHVFKRESTKGVVFIEKTDTNLRLYPVSWMCWDKRKGSFHGQSPITGLAPNWRFINKLFAMMGMSLMNTAFPRLVYDKTRVSAPTNAVGQMYGVNGEVTGAMTYLNGAQQSGNVMSSIEAAIKYTKDMLGASDAFMGDIRPENKSAIIAVTKNASIPLENVKANLYQFVEDMVMVWLDMMRAYYGVRDVVRNELGMEVKKPFDFSSLGSYDLSVHVDVGASSYWSEIGMLQTLDTLLQQKLISPELYIELIPDTVLSGKQKIVDHLKASNKTQQVLNMALMQFVQGLPPEQQQAIRNMPEDQMQSAAMEMYLQAQQGGQRRIPAPIGGAAEAASRPENVSGMSDGMMQ